MASGETRGSVTSDLDRAAGRLELGSRRRGEPDALHGVRAVGVPGAQQLHGTIALADEAGGEERFGIDELAGHLAQLPQVDRLGRHLERVGEPALRNAPVERHLAALEAGVRGAAGPGLMALVPLPRRLAEPRPDPPAHPLAHGRGAGRRAKRGEGDRRDLGLICHYCSLAGVTSTRWRTLYSMPRIAAVFLRRTVCCWCRRPRASSVR